MSSGIPSEERAVDGIHVHQARDVTLRAGGDIVAGDKTTIHNYYGPKPQDITKAPYKFLSYYDIGDRDIFFGRDAVIEELAGEIPRHKVLIINGQSGSGKTSLINAGLIPRLAENGYLYVYFRDYTNPIQQLRDYFRDHPEFALPDADKLSLLQILRTIRSQQESPVVFIFDQFERFLINVAAEPRREFLQQLRECLESDLTADELNLVISLRDDFFGKLLLEAEAIIPTFGTDSHHHNLRTLNRDEARQAIVQPLKNIPNIGFDGKFVDDVLLPHLMGQATGEAKIEPPHLQIVCNQLYEAARARARNRQQLEDGEPVRIGFDLYHDLGETDGMLRDYLDDVVRRITNGDAKQIAIVRSTLKLMIETVGTRKFESVDDISTNLPDVARTETERIIQKLQESRVLEAKQFGNETEFSLSHEFMVAKVQSWYDERELQRKKAKDTLDRGLVRWASTKALLDDTEIEAIQQWVPNASDHKAVRELLAQSIRRQTRLKWQRRTAFAAVTIAVLLMPIAVIAWITSAYNANMVRQQAATAELTVGVRLCRDGHVDEGLLWFARSLRTAPNDAADLQSAIRENLTAWSAFDHELVGWHRYEKVVAISPDGAKSASMSKRGDIQFWETESGQSLGQLAARPTPVRSVAFGYDDTTVVTASDDGTVQFWNLKTGEPSGNVIRGVGRIEPNGLSLSRDGKLLLTAAKGARFQLWNRESGEVIKDFTPDGLAGGGAAISADGTKIATGGLDCGFIMDVDTGVTIARIFLNVSDWNTIETLAFSADGEKLVAGSGSEAQIVLVNKRDSERPESLAAVQPIGPVIRDGGKFVSFYTGDKTHDDIKIVTSNGNDVQIWRLTTEGQAGVQLDGSSMKNAQSGRRAKAFSSNGDKVAVSDGTAIRFWDPQTGKPLGAPLPHQEEVRAMAYSSNDEFIATASGKKNTTLQLWNVGTKLPTSISINQELPVGALAICSGDEHVVTASILTDEEVSGGFPKEPMEIELSANRLENTGVIQVWDKQGKPIGRPFQPIRPKLIAIVGFNKENKRDEIRLAYLKRQIYAAAFSSDGRFVAIAWRSDILKHSEAASQGATVRVWNTETRAVVGGAIHHHPSEVVAMALSVDAKRLLTISKGDAQLWDTGTGQPIGQVVKHPDTDYAVALTSDGRRAAMASAENAESAVQVWNAPTAMREDVKWIASWTECVTQGQLDRFDSVQSLDVGEWNQRWKVLNEYGRR